MKPVTLRINSKIVDLYGEESLGLDFAAFDIEELGKQQGALSINFNVPATANNRNIFGNPQEVNNLAQDIYQEFECALFVDGINIRINTAILISATEQDFELRVYNKQATVYQQIKALKVGDVDLHEWDHFQNYNSIAGIPINGSTPLCDNDDTIVYPVISSSEKERTDIYDNTTRDYFTAAAIPVIYADSLLAKIFEHIGYTLINNISSDEWFDGSKLAFTPKGKWKRNNDKNRYLGTALAPNLNLMVLPNINPPARYDIDGSSASVTFTGAYDYVAYNSLNIWPYGYSFTKAVFSPQGIFIVDSLRFISIRYKIKIQNPFATNGGFVQPIINQYSEDNLQLVDLLYTGDTVLIPPFSTVDLDFTYTSTRGFSEGDRIGLVLKATGNAGFIGYVKRLEVEIVDLEIESGGSVTIKGTETNPFRWVTASSIVDRSWDCGKFVSEYLKLFNGISQVDDIRKTVTFVPFSKLSDNIGIAYNWTNKVDYFTEPKIEFIYDGLAQRNNFTYKETTESNREDFDGNDLPVFERPPNTDYSFSVNNTRLKEEEDLIESEFGFANMRSILLGLNTAYVPMYADIKPDASSYHTPDEYKYNVLPSIPLLVKRVNKNDFEDNSQLAIQGETDVSSPQKRYFDDFYIAWFIDSQRPNSMGFGENVVAEFYAYLENILTNYKKVTMRLNLNPVDIRTLDFQRPVYISGVYYYINAVNGYDPINGGSTEVELIKLNPYG